MNEQWVFEDVGTEDNDRVGKKCANLGEMRRAGIRVPPGFAVSLRAYEKFMTETGAHDEITGFLGSFEADPNDMSCMAKFSSAEKRLRRIVESKKMPSEMQQTIIDFYEEMCKRIGRPDVPVAVRSAGKASHPGQYETFLHVRGPTDLIRSIIRVWSSTFNARSLIARARSGLPLEFDPIGVAILQMIEAKSAGVMFTLNPVNGDISKIVIGGNWGLGEGVVSGDVPNDQWLVDKVTLEIIESRIEKKNKECLFDPRLGGIVLRELPLGRQLQPCLSEEELIELAKNAKKVEEHFGVPQDIEWVIDASSCCPQSVYLVQARPETTWSKVVRKSVLETKKQFKEYDILELVKG